MTNNLVLELREKTGIGMMDCKKALIECGNDIDVTQEYLLLMSIAVSRRKRVNGELVTWANEDYLKEAKRRCKK